jgi:hypothetical protein
MLALAVLAPALPAMPAAAQATRNITLEPSPGCPGRASFADDVARLVGPIASAEEPDRLDVRLRDLPGAVQVTLRVTRRGGAVATRSLELPRCDEANDAAVLLAALAIDPNAKLPERPPEPAPTARPAAAAPEAEPAATGPSRLAALMARPLFVRVAGLLDTGTLDDPAFGAAAELGGSAGRLELALGARYLPRHALDNLPGNAEVHLTLGQATLRGGVRIPLGKVALIPGVSVGLGALRAASRNVEGATARRAFNGDVALGVLAEWAPTPHFALDLGADLALEWLRPRIALDGRAIYSVPAVAGRAAFGLRFWSVLPRTSR